MQSRRAFSLVELSIVLVILGLLVGGVLSGQSLIRAAELRSVTTQFQRYLAATQTFRDKYFAIPGDFNNATAFWGTAAVPASCAATAGTGTQTCNGNGNGEVNYSYANSEESFRFWQHLANAGLIEGNFDGITHGSTIYSATTANSPAGRLGTSLWFVNNVDSGAVYSADATMFAVNYSNWLLFGATVANSSPIVSILKPEEMWNIDTKMDDGLPGQGKVIGNNISTCTTTSTNTTLTATYLLSSSALGCVAYFRQAF